MLTGFKDRRPRNLVDIHGRVDSLGCSLVLDPPPMFPLLGSIHSLHSWIPPLQRIQLTHDIQLFLWWTRFHFHAICFINRYSLIIPHRASQQIPPRNPRIQESAPLSQPARSWKQSQSPSSVGAQSLRILRDPYRILTRLPTAQNNPEASAGIRWHSQASGKEMSRTKRRCQLPNSGPCAKLR